MMKIKPRFFRKSFFAFLMILILSPWFIVSCGDKTDSDVSIDRFDPKDDPIDGDINDPNDPSDRVESLQIVEVGEILNLELTIYTFTFSGTVEIISFMEKGDFIALMEIDGLSSSQVIRGNITGDALTIDSMTIEHAYASGMSSNFEATISDDRLSAEGTFQFTIEESTAYPSYEGVTLNGSYTLSKRLSASVFTEVDYVYNLEVTLAGYRLSGTATVTSLDEKTGELTAVFEIDGVADSVIVEGIISGDILYIEPFTIEHSIASGTITEHESTYDALTNTLSGTFKFKLEKSSFYSEYVGMSFYGTQTISR